MRTLTSALLAFCLLFGVPHPATAADKIKIEIVEATTTIILVPRTYPGTPERITTHCDTRVDVNCVSTVTPGTDSSSGLVPEIALFAAKAILPDGSHVELTCSPVTSKKCKGIAHTPDSTECIMNAMLLNRDAAGKTCITKNLGIYRAKRKQDEITIYVPSGKLEYRIAGSW